MGNGKARRYAKKSIAFARQKNWNMARRYARGSYLLFKKEKDFTNEERLRNIYHIFDDMIKYYEI